METNEMTVIKIYQGDEYRAKIEKKQIRVTKNDLFYSVYCRAWQITEEIGSAMEHFRNETSTEDYAKCLGMGNNILVFNGGRGHGKTSAMQSFSKMLKGEVKLEKNSSKEKEDYVPEKNYVVLEAIDPSAIESRETIIKVLLSRLFHKLQMMDKGTNKIWKESSLEKKIGKITKLFRQCFANIEYLKLNVEREWEQDDLETLSQLGSSGRFKENLNELINLFLELMCGKTDSEKKRYLVVQIDDVDLATRRVFEICEDIRNYLSIPNVIVLMAMDCERLEYAIYQSFLTEHKHLIKLQNKMDITDKCFEMAMQYMEKILPNGHRITLPNITEEILERSWGLLLEYMVKLKETEKWENILEEETKGCNDIQEQLFRILYDRTGIVLLKPKDGMHIFVPQTMRELTHFIKMLMDMEKIKWEKVYLPKEDYSEIEKLLNNLSMIEHYFTEDWCAKRLDTSENELMLKINRENQKRNNAAIFNHIQKFCKSSPIIKEKGKQITYHELLNNIQKSTISNTTLEEAIHIFFTIFLSKQFAYACKTGNFEKYVEFKQEPFNLQIRYYIRNELDSYYFFRFHIEVERLHLFIAENGVIEGEKLRWLQMFCIPANGMTEDMIVCESGRMEINPEIKELEFDILRPILHMFMRKPFIIHKQEQASKITSEEDMEIVEDMQEVDQQWRYVDSIRNILSNYDVQELLQGQLTRKYNHIRKEKKSYSLLHIIRQFYDLISRWTVNVEFLGIKQENISEYFKDIFDVNLLTVVFLSNSKNYETFQKEYEKRMHSIISGKLKEIEVGLSDSMNADKRLAKLQFDIYQDEEAIIDIHNFKDFCTSTEVEKITGNSSKIEKAYQKVCERVENYIAMKSISAEEVKQAIVECKELLNEKTTES